MSCSMAILGSFKGEVAFRGSSDVTKGFQGFFSHLCRFFLGLSLCFKRVFRRCCDGIQELLKGFFLVLLHVAARGWCQF